MLAKGPMSGWATGATCPRESRWDAGPSRYQMRGKDARDTQCPLRWIPVTEGLPRALDSGGRDYWE